MGLDIRLPIGMLFTVVGLLLLALGIAGNSAIYSQSLGINLNRDWGAVLLLFGVVMLLFGMRGTAVIRRKTTIVNAARQNPQKVPH
jgi:hypothetical protein